MAGSLFAALSGLKAHQAWIDVVGNNLANSNTPGFKESRATFADALTETLRYATGPSASAGGRNPAQLGTGVALGSIRRNLSQGGLMATGRVFDLALEGRGFFALTDGSMRVFTRVGTFGLDSASNLVEQNTGFRALDPLGQPIVVDTESLFPPRATSEIEVGGNLPAHVTGPLAEVLTSSNALTEGSPAVLTGTVAGPSFAVAPGATMSLELELNGGVPELVSVTDSDSDGFLTGAEIVAEIDAIDGISASIASGFIEIATDRTGDAVSLKVDAGPSGSDLAGLIGMPPALATGSEVDVSLATDLNSLPANVDDYQVGDVIQISGVDTDGAPVNSVFTYGVDGTTVGELVSFIDGLYTDAEVSLDSSGQIVVEAQTAGEAGLLLTLSDGPSSVGGTEWFEYELGVTTEGTGPDTFVTSTELYDAAGQAHTLTLTFERQADLTWTMTASIPAERGTIATPPVTGIAFRGDGTPVGFGAIDTTVSILFAGQTEPQLIEFELGTDGQFDGLTQFGGQDSVFVEFQDGYGDGELANINVDSSGSIEGFYTNGQVRSLGQLGVATFRNAEGLADAGANLWQQTLASGVPNLGTGNALGAGRVASGVLEGSNVDTAEQFVQLIEAQRGFQANARVITTQDEVLAEVVNLI